MALPALTGNVVHAAGSSVPDKHLVSIHHSQYSEAELDGSPRYDIGVQQFMATGPMGEAESYSGSLTLESMSGASPMMVTPDVDGTPLVVMSGASIEEKRTDVGVGMNFFAESSTAGVTASYSGENDYSSLSFGLSHSSYFNDKNTSFDLAAGVSFDEITPTDAGKVNEDGDLLYPLRPLHENKQSLNASFGLSHAMSRNWLVGGSANTAVFSGFMSDPYKAAWVAGEILADSRPDLRTQLGVNLQSRYFVNAANAAWHANYRFFTTDWGTESHTLDMSWYQNLGKWQVTPTVRYYTQTAANFFKNYYLAPRADGYYSSDYRLSDYDAISARLTVTREFNNFRLYGMYENYDSGSSDSDPLRGESPALVDFSYFSLGVDIFW